MNRLSQTKTVARVVFNQNWYRNFGHLHKQRVWEGRNSH